MTDKQRLTDRQTDIDRRTNNKMRFEKLGDLQFRLAKNVIAMN